MDTDILQSAVDLIQKQVLKIIEGYPDVKGNKDGNYVKFMDKLECPDRLRVLEKTELGETVAVNYECGLSLYISKCYLEENGHKLESAVVHSACTFTKYINQKELLSEVIDMVIRNFKFLCPKDLRDTFNKLDGY